MNKTIASLLFTLFFASNILAFQIVTPVNQWAGKTNDETHSNAAPESGIVTTQKEFAELWKKWHESEETPEIDFSKHLVLATTVGGPNRMMIPDQMQLTDGDLAFRCAATRMGGPGFGHALVQVPRDGIKSVNGVAVPMAAKKVEDSVQVNMVGTIETGIMAIGGETTGVMITSGNISWELQVPAALREKVEGFNGRKARVKGQLEKKAGVEIRERWIVTVESVEDPMNKEDDDKADDDEAAFGSIEIMQSGGFAGVAIRHTLTPEGKLTVKNRNETRISTLPANKMRMIQELIANTNWAQVPASTKDKNVADDFHYLVTVDTGKGNFQFEISGMKLDEVEALGKLVQWIQ